MPPTSPAPRERIASIDLLRGIVMVFMLLDHARDFVHRDGLTRNPSDPDTTTAALFFTRWITHFCAPTFVLLAGASARIQLDRGVERKALASFLVERGLILVALELVLLRPLIWFQLDYSFAAHLQVIWAIGWSMCALGVLLRAVPPLWAAPALGVALALTHNLVAHRRFTFAPLLSWEGLGLLLERKGALALAGEDGPIAFVQYPLLPWFAVMACGFGVGSLYAFDAAMRRRRLLTLGAALTLAFLLLRGLRLYGDPVDWRPRDEVLRSLFAFLDVEKYPPSLHYLAMTLGPALVALALLERGRLAAPLRVLATIGRVPLFFYVLQWPAVHLTSRLFQWLDGQPLGWDTPNPLTLEGDLPAGCGFGLGAVYLAFALCLAVLAPLSLAFARWKTAHAERRWLRYY